YDTETAFAPISKVGSVSALLLVPADSPARDVESFITQAKAKPGGLNYGSVGRGSLGDLTMLLFQSAAGVQLTHVPYKSDPQVLTALIQGDLHAAFVSPSSSLAMLRAGKIRALAIAEAERLPVVPDVPTLAESGL